MNNSDVVIVGAGIAGMVCAYECLQRGLSVHMVDRHPREKIGGLARWAFGGMALVDTPLQRRMKIKDSPELAWQDWQSFAEFTPEANRARDWGRYYVEHSRKYVYDYLIEKGMRFLPAVNWVERGRYGEGNSVPRYHVLWGTGYKLVECFAALLLPFESRGQLELSFGTRCDALLYEADRVIGCRIVDETTQAKREVYAQQTVVATGGINGNLQKVRQHWKQAPHDILNGAHPFADGAMHDAVEDLGGKVTHLDNMWNYAAGIPHPQPHFDGHGLSLIPPKSALWLDHRGQRIGPEPLVTGFDTHDLCARISELDQPYTWQVLNWRIAAKELAISGSEHNPSIRDGRTLRFLKEILLGNHALVNQLHAQSDHFLVARTLDELADKMNQLNGNTLLDKDALKRSVMAYDANVGRGKNQWNDDQLRRIVHARAWRPDKLRTCAPAPLLTPKHGPLIAMKLRLITRKSLGGIQTDLQSRALDQHGEPIGGLYAIGEAAGFGGGGASGKRSLEGTFLSGCVLTAQCAAQHIGQ